MSYPRSFVATGTEQRDFCKFLALFIPSAMSSAYKFTIITPGVGERIVRRRLASVEPESCTFSQKMRADERVLTLAVSCALNLVRHPDTIPAGESTLSTPGAFVKSSSQTT